jgi:hypothetical protein
LIPLVKIGITRARVDDSTESKPLMAAEVLECVAQEISVEK